MSNTMTAWGEAVKIELIKRHMTIAQLADHLGMSRSYVSSVINGRVYYEPAVRKISDFLGIPDTADAVSV